VEIVKEKYPVGSRVNYQCRTTDNNDQPESGPAKGCLSQDGTSWDVRVLCSKNGAWSHQFSEQINYRHNNLTRNLPTGTSLDSNQDLDYNYWVYNYSNLLELSYKAIISALFLLYFFR